MNKLNHMIPLLGLTEFSTLNTANKWVMGLCVHFSQNQHSSILAEMSTAIRRNVRWLLLLALMIYASTILLDLPWRWPKFSGAWHLWCGLGLSCFFAHLCQASMTREVVACCGGRLELLTALRINVLGGLWGLLLPMGSVGYKAIYLKRKLALGPYQYGKWYLWASLVNLALGAGVMILCWWSYLPQWSLALVLLLAVIAMLLKRQCFGLIARFGLLQSHLSLAVQRLLWVQTLGLLAYVGMYVFSLSLFGIDISLKYGLSIVVFQSWLFLVPIVPGNLVLLESLVAWVLLGAGVPLELSIAATLLNRGVMLTCLLALAPWAQWTLPKPEELSSDLSSSS